MKSVISIAAAVSLLQLTSAQPHRRHAHQDQHVKKDVVTVVNTVFAEESGAPLVVVVVDESGAPVSTTTENAYAAPVSTQTASSSATSVASVASSTTPILDAAVFVASTSSAEVSTSSSVYVPTSTYVASSSSSSAAAASSSASASTGNGYGFTYGPYYANGDCKDADAVLQDLKAIPSGYSIVRTYGTDCNTAETVLAACKQLGLTLFAGVYDLDSLTSELDLIISAADGDWSSVYGVGIGNELVNSGTADAGTVTAAISTARSYLRNAKFEGPVGTVDTLVATRSNPSLCDSSDVCWMNSHPFFDGATEADASGSFLTTQIETIKSVLADSSQKIVITETGWPSKGDTNGVAVPSTANQEAAVSAIKTAFSSSPDEVFLFNVYNMLWKTSDSSQFNAEQWWGFAGYAPSG